MKPVNTALLSFGMSGVVFHAPLVHVHPGFTFYAVWERTKNLAQEKFPGVNTYRSLEALLNDTQVELVVVNTPNYTHYDYTKKALLAAKHVIVEKPFTVTVAQGEELIALAKEQGLCLSVYQNRRYDSDFRTVRKILEQNLLGRVVEAEFHFDRYSENLSPKLHKEEPGPGRGALYDLGSHIIDQALQLFGWPQAVFADIQVIRPLSKVDDFFEVLLYYPDKRVRLRCSYLVREPLPGYVIHGNKGSFIKAKTDVQEKALLAGKLPDAGDWGMEPETEKGFLHTEKNGEVVKEFITSERGNYVDYYEGMYQSILHNRPVPVPAEEALNVIRIIEAAFQSNEQKKVITLSM